MVYSCACSTSTSAFEETAIGSPDVFARRGKVNHCENNAIVSAWCDSRVTKGIECGILPEFDEYACGCDGDSSLCPDECIEDSLLQTKTHYGIRCSKIPQDTPNYVLKETHQVQRCENNAVVAAWCDESINPHLECHLYEKEDQYLCKCSGKVANCPTECINGKEALVTAHGSVLCQNIPEATPNYVLKDA